MTTRTGKAPDPITQSRALYLQGMNGDVRKNGSKRSVSFTDSAGDTLTDRAAWSGVAYQTTTYSGNGGSARAETLNHPWQSPATATKSRSGSLPDLVARYANTDRVDARQKLADGSWRTAQTVTTYNNDTGLPTTVDDKGQIDADGTPVGGTTPEKCTHTSYATDADRNIRSLPSQVITTQGGCSSSVDAHTLSATRTYYDGSTTLGTVPGAGDATTTQDLKTATPDVAWAAASTSSYDRHGRVIKTIDPLGRTSSTSYGDSTTDQRYLPAATTETNPKGWTTSTSYDPGRQLPLTSTDVNDRTTTETYDGLGRLRQVWLPSHPKADHSSTPSMTFDYAVSGDSFVSVTTNTLRDNNSYGTDVKIYDALLRLRQEQSMPKNAASHARLIAATGYDSTGQTINQVKPFYNTDSGPQSTPVQIVPAQVPAETRTSFDGQGRAVSSALFSNGTKQWATTTAYPGADETDVTPPTGGTPSATITDARGQKVQLRQFHGSAASGAYDVSYYSYDAAGRQTKLVGPLAQDADPDSSKLVWTSGYDAAGNVVTATDPDTGTTTSRYDDDNELVSTTDNAGQTLTTGYDVLGRKTAVRNGDASGPVINAWSYDTAAGGKGQLASATAYAADGVTPTWSHSVEGYNAFGKPTGESTTIPAGAYGNTVAISYDTTTSYTSVLGNVDLTTIKETGTGGLIGTETYGFSYNDAGLPMASGGLETYESWTNYDPHGQLVRATSGIMPKQMVVTNSWDEPTGRLLNATVSKEDGTSAVDSTDYTYDASGRVTSVTDTRDGGGAVDRQCFGYDYLGRLRQAWTDAGGTHTAQSPSVQGVGGCDTADPAQASLSGPAPYWRSFSYDLTGNRLSSTDHAATPGASDRTTRQSYAGLDTVHAVHTVTIGDSATSWDYDGDGRPTGTTTSVGGVVDGERSRSMSWTAGGRLSSLTVGAPDDPQHATGYGYDVDGNLVARTVDAVTTLYLGSDAIRVSDGVACEVDRSYAFPGGPTAVRVATADKSSLHWQAADPHGTGTVDIDAADLTVTRRLYTPFGQDRTLAGTGDWAGDKGFVGGTRDQVNQLTNLGAREYNPALGRFLSPDPDLDYNDPQALNNYAYSDNAPTNKTDPDGKRLACTESIPCGPTDSDHPRGRYYADSRYTGPHPTIGYSGGHVVHYHSRLRLAGPSGKSGRKHHDPKPACNAACRLALWTAKHSGGLLRNAINLPVTAIGLAYAHDSGGSCSYYAPKMMFACTGATGMFLPAGRAGFTIGSTYIQRDSRSPSHRRLRHESKHADQWAWFGGGIGFPIAYFVAEGVSGGGRNNPFERQAGLKDGSY